MKCVKISRLTPLMSMSMDNWFTTCPALVCRNPPMPISIAGITLAKATMLVSRSALILANAASSCPHHQRASVECLLQLLMDSSSTNAALSIFLALHASLYSCLVGVASTIVHRPHHPTTGARKVPAEATATNKRPAMERDALQQAHGKRQLLRFLRSANNLIMHGLQNANNFSAC